MIFLASEKGEFCFQKRTFSLYLISRRVYPNNDDPLWFWYTHYDVKHTFRQ